MLPDAVGKGEMMSKQGEAEMNARSDADSVRIAAVFEQLSRSSFRSQFHLVGADLQYLRKQGLPQMAQHAGEFIAQRLAPAHPVNDGKQTPWRGHPVFVAQHATATCCRTCLGKWHGLTPGVLLSAQQQAYVVEVIVHWLQLENERAQADPAIPDAPVAKRKAKKKDLQNKTGQPRQGSLF
ncbi:DUF4186 domain-containing protein [Herbaspirillum lusitanum]|jgi:hypothetical protein|uniref:DUF4186 domain-containing protein n=1 Tax=Herbaspirillum lusitanum TaxID=213312 RepID=A0ABW9ACE7_9BURK